MFRDRDRIDWSSFVVGDLISVMMIRRDAGTSMLAIQGVYVGCEVAKRERFLRIMGEGGVATVSCTQVHDLRVLASISDSEEA